MVKYKALSFLLQQGKEIDQGNGTLPIRKEEMKFYAFLNFKDAYFP